MQTSDKTIKIKKSIDYIISLSRIKKQDQRPKTKDLRKNQETRIKKQEKAKRNNKSQAPQNKACPSLFDGEITISNDQNHKRKKLPSLEFEICDLSLKQRGTSSVIWDL